MKGPIWGESRRFLKLYANQIALSTKRPSPAAAMTQDQIEPNWAFANIREHQGISDDYKMLLHTSKSNDEAGKSGAPLIVSTVTRRLIAGQ